MLWNEVLGQYLMSEKVNFPFPSRKLWTLDFSFSSQNSGTAFNISLSLLKKGDIVIEGYGAKVIIDEISVPYIQGSIIDYKNDLIGQSFEIKNPNATSECGCGTSFSSRAIN